MYKLKKHIKIIVMAALTILCFWQTGMIVKAESAYNSLASLKLSEGTLSPSFVYNVVDYTATVSADTSSVEVTAATSNAAASIQSGTGTVSLKEGANTVKIVVAAENGNLATYTITITRGASGASEPSVTTPSGQDQTGSDEPSGQDGTGTDEPSGQGGTGTDEPSGQDGTGTDEPTGQDGAGADGSTPAVTGADGYTVSSEIPGDMVPPDFSETTVAYEGQEQKAFSYNKGSVTLL